MTIFLLWITGILLVVMPLVWLFYKPVNCPKRQQTIEQRESIKNESLYWDEWSGSRFIRQTNPQAFSKGKRKIKTQIARSNPVTGDYEVLVYE